jgi:hypothetical protein
LHDLLQPVHAVLSVGQHVLVDCLDALVVVLQGMFNLVGGVLGILQAPGLGVVNGAGRRLVLMVWGRGRVVRSCVSHCMVDGSSVDNGMSHCMVDGSNMVLHDGLVMGSAMVGNAVGGMVHCGNMGSVVRNWSSMDNWGSLVVDERGDCCLVNWSLVVSRSALMVHRGTYMVGRLRTIDRGGDGGVAVGSSMVNLGVGLSLGFCTGGGGDKRQNNQV